jgi:ferredoxin-NADP reductase
MLTASRVAEGFTPPGKIAFVVGSTREVLEQPCEIDPRGRDVYLAGPRRFNAGVLEALDRCGIARERVVVETIGD